VWAGVVHLRPGTREHFLGHLARDWPHLVPYYQRLFGNRAYAPRATQEEIRKRVGVLREEAKGSRAPVLRPREPAGQLALL
jgi:hypothetical protein